MNRTRFVLLAAAALLGLAATGCGGGSNDRSGGTSNDRAGGTRRPQTVVLTLAGHESGSGVRDWIDAVQRLSHGSLRIEVKNSSRRGEAGYEKKTIADVRAGKVDLASIPARAYDTIGARSFQGLLAPFLVDSYALEHKVPAGDLPARMLSGVKPLGVIGIALLPGPLQKVLSISGPMLAPSDYRRQPDPIGIRTSELAAGTFRALGVTSTEALGGDTSRMAGIEQGLVEIVANRYQAATAGETLSSNVNFWPRVMSIVMNDKTNAALSPAQREALKSAGREALGPAMRRLAREERAALDVICNPPGDDPTVFFFLTASPSSLTALRSAVRPVYRRLDRDRVARAAIAAIEEMKKHVTAEAAPCCPGARPPHAGAAARALRVTGDLTATSHTTWAGTVTSTGLGRGCLALKGQLRFRSFVTGRYLQLTARFLSGVLRGCVCMAVTPTRHRTFSWGGPGVIVSASRPLRRYVGLSLRFGGVTKASDLSHVHGGFVSDAPSGLPCDARQGV
jgi:TRAP-type C4-dicarboxylate transport system substrate-binding protein